jgi:hypothetical protein
MRLDGDGYLVCGGGALKALDDSGKVGGHLVLFGDPAHTDASDKRDFFTPDTDFGPFKTSLVFYNHTLDDELDRRVLDESASLKTDRAGIWMEGQLKLRDAYEKKLFGAIKDGKMGLSSGTASHLVRREKQPNGSHKILYWPLGLDASITPTPAEPRTMAVAIKSLAEFKAQHLGELIVPSMAAGALDRLRAACDYRVYDHLHDRKRPVADRLDAIKGCYTEHMGLAMKCVKALMDDDDSEDSDGAEMKALMDSSLQRLHAGLRLGAHLDLARAAVAGVSDRLADLAAKRAADGRSLSAERRGAIKALRDGLDTLLQACKAAPAPEGEDDRLFADYLALEARLAGNLPWS